MAIWQEDNPLRRRLEAKVKDKYNHFINDVCKEEYETYIRLEQSHKHQDEQLQQEETTQQQFQKKLLKQLILLTLPIKLIIFTKEEALNLYLV